MLHEREDRAGDDDASVTLDMPGTSTLAPLPSHIDWYSKGHLAPFVQVEKRMDGDLSMLEAAQPAGDMSDPPTRSLVLIRNLTPGLHQQSDLGGGRFEERSQLGAMFLVPPGVATEIEVYMPHRIRCLGIDQELVAAAMQDAEGRRIALDFGALARRSFRDPALEGLCRTLWYVCDEVDGPARLMADAAIVFMVQRLAGLAGRAARTPRGGLAPWQVRRVTEAIAEMDGDVLSLAVLADLAGLSQFHFCRAFKLSLGVTPYRYQLMRRVERARSLLANTDRSVTDIAFEVGYGSSQAFGRVFRAEVGVSPSEYRREKSR